MYVLVTCEFTSLHTQLHSLCGECPRGTIIVIYECVILRRDCLGSITNRPTMQISSHTLCIKWRLCLFPKTVLYSCAAKTVLHPSTVTLSLCQMDVGISEEVVVPWWYCIHRYEPIKACLLINGQVGNHICGMTNTLSSIGLLLPMLSMHWPMYRQPRPITFPICFLLHVLIIHKMTKEQLLFVSHYKRCPNKINTICTVRYENRIKSIYY